MEALEQIVPQVIVPCQGEVGVKQYHCTHLRSILFGLRAEGVLQVTNKRTIFRASGKSITGKSIIQSEVPIEDISGISLYKGTYFSLKHFILGIILTLFVGSIFLMALIALSFNSEQYSKVLLWVCFFGSLFGIYRIPRKEIWNPIVASLGVVSMSMLMGGSLFYGLMGGSWLYGSTEGSSSVAFFGILTLIMVGYTVLALFLYARRLTVSLMIGSKGGTSTPIYISGIRSLGYANSAAPKAIEAEPTEETEELIKELGAIIMDIQGMGEYGIEKWAEN